MASFENCTGYLVTENHQWVPAVNTGTISESGTPLGAEFVSALGSRTFFSRGTAPREWQVTAKAPWAWVKNLKALERAGAQRLYWVSPLGVHTNILPTSRPLAGTNAGIRMVQGQAVEIFFQTVDYPTSGWVPVQPGMKLYGAAYQASGDFYIEFRNAAGQRMPVPEIIPAPLALGLVESSVTVPSGAVEAHLVSRRPSQVGGYSIRLETHGLAQPSESACAWVTLHDVQISHSNIAFEHSPVEVSFTLKEVA